MEFTSKVKNKKLCGQAREIVANVLLYFQRLAADNKNDKNMQKVQKNVSTATGVSLQTIQNIASEMKIIEDGEQSCFQTPDKKRKKQPLKRI